MSDQGVTTRKSMTPVEEFILHSNWIEDERSSEAFDDAMKAWKYICEVQRMTPFEIKNVHFILMRQLRPDIAGRWRTCDITIAGKLKRYIHTDVFETQIRELCDLMNDLVSFPELDYAANVAKVAHVGFENIHPFEDGNGRLGRILYNWHRLRMGLPIHVIREGDEQIEYYKWFR